MLHWLRVFCKGRKRHPSWPLRTTTCGKGCPTTCGKGHPSWPLRTTICGKGHPNWPLRTMTCGKGHPNWLLRPTTCGKGRPMTCGKGHPSWPLRPMSCGKRHPTPCGKGHPSWPLRTTTWKLSSAVVAGSVSKVTEKCLYNEVCRRKNEKCSFQLLVVLEWILREDN